jgi:Uma2 family endonuclease
MTTTRIIDKQQYGVRTRRFTSNEFSRLVASGILPEDERVELLRGEIIPMAPIGSRHAACVNGLTLLFSPLLSARRVLVAVQNPVHLDDYSEPQPDLVVARFRADLYAGNHPAPPDILLLIEVADSSEEFDRTIKLPLYAQAGIIETWLINLNQNTVEAYRTPSLEGYRDMHTYLGEERLSPAALPDFSIAVSDVFPKI